MQHPRRDSGAIPRVMLHVGQMKQLTPSILDEIRRCRCRSCCGRRGVPHHTASSHSCLLRYELFALSRTLTDSTRHPVLCLRRQSSALRCPSNTERIFADLQPSLVEYRPSPAQSTAADLPVPFERLLAYTFQIRLLPGTTRCAISSSSSSIWGTRWV